MTSRCRTFAPPKNSITSISMPVQRVTDMFGSKMMSRQMPAPAPNTGSIPKKVRMRGGSSAA